MMKRPSSAVQEAPDNDTKRAKGCGKNTKTSQNDKNATANDKNATSFKMTKNETQQNVSIGSGLGFLDEYRLFSIKYRLNLTKYVFFVKKYQIHVESFQERHFLEIKKSNVKNQPEFSGIGIMGYWEVLGVWGELND